MSSKLLTPAGIDAVCDLVDDLCGICWDESKAYLIEARLEKIVQESSCVNYEELVRKVRAEIVPGLKDQVIDAVTTNETLWFRDASPFEALKHKLVPEIIDEKAKGIFPRRLRIWSAACSTGQEAYSIAMTLADLIPDYLEWDIQILGTDISPAAVQQASRGEYSNLEVGRGLTSTHLNKHFTDLGKSWKISDELRSLCHFQTRNLHQPFTGLGPFDVIFCRNVAIYFNDKDRVSLFERLADVLNTNGWIIVGSSESLAQYGTRWQPEHHCRANCYHPNRPARHYV